MAHDCTKVLLLTYSHVHNENLLLMGYAKQVCGSGNSLIRKLHGRKVFYNTVSCRWSHQFMGEAINLADEYI